MRPFLHCIPVLLLCLLLTSRLQAQVRLSGTVSELNRTVPLPGVSVLTNNAVPAKQLDAGKAQTQLEAAKSRPANTPELLAIRERDQQRARAQLRVAKK